MTQPNLLMRTRLTFRDSVGGIGTPFAGYGQSGYGGEKGREALWNDVQMKNVAIGIKD